MPQLYGAVIHCPVYRYGASAGTLSGCGSVNVKRLQSLSGADVGYECEPCGMHFQDRDINFDRTVSTDSGMQAHHNARIVDRRYVR